LRNACTITVSLMLAVIFYEKNGAVKAEAMEKTNG
jgi:hypothetical protein